MALLVLTNSFCSMLMNVRTAAMVRCWGMGCQGVAMVGDKFLPLALDS